MARYTREFRWEQGEDTGEWGWIPGWLYGAESTYAMTGDGTAHDTLEHEARESDGDLENEARALGATYFVRGESGWFSARRGNPDVEQNLASDFVELYRALQRGDDMGDTLSPIVDPHGMRDTFSRIVRDGVRRAIAEYRSEPDGREWLAQFAQGRRALLRHMIGGYTAARARFDGNCCNARHLFERIAEAARAASREAEESGNKSARLIIDVDTLAGKFHAVCELYENPTFGDGPLDR